MLTEAQLALLAKPVIEQVQAPTYAATLDRGEIYALVTALFPAIAAEYTAEEVEACAKVVADKGQPVNNMALITQCVQILSEAIRLRAAGFTNKIAEDPKSGSQHAHQFAGRMIGDKTPRSK